MTRRRRIAPASVEIVVSTRGAIGANDVERAREKVAHALGASRRPVLFAHLSLLHEPDPAVERPSLAKASVDLDGRLVRAHASARSMEQAIDELEARLRRRLAETSDRARARRHDVGAGPPGEWRHGNLAAQRPHYYPRPVEERQLLRRKTFAVAPLTFEEATSEMDALDHHFYLFVDAQTGEDTVVARRPEGGVERLDAADALTSGVEDAIERLNLTDAPFLFFVDSERRRGCIVYRRYDGHTGLIEPSA
jgi:ribosome-associated translation inhibitor RaiA